MGLDSPTALALRLPSLSSRLSGDFRRLCRCLGDELRQNLVRLRPHDAAPVRDERGHAGDAELPAASPVGIDPLAEPSFEEDLPGDVYIEPNCRSLSTSLRHLPLGIYCRSPVDQERGKEIVET